MKLSGMIDLGVLMKFHYITGLAIPWFYLRGMQSWGKFESRLQRWLCHLAQEQAIDLGISELDRGHIDDSRALIEVKILFGLHRDITA